MGYTGAIRPLQMQTKLDGCTSARVLVVRRVRHYWRRISRRLTAALTLAAVAACTVGVPMPVSAVKTSAERFPCENSPCGCANAASCWRECCCKTHSQKLAWARENQVRPPKFVVAAARKERLEAAALAAKPSCCHSKEPTNVASCCKKPATTQSHACCKSSTVGSPSGGREDASMNSHRSEGKVVLLVSALRCRGISVSVSLMPPSLPLAPNEPPTLVSVSYSRALSLPLLYLSPTDDVATPPPDACG